MGDATTRFFDAMAASYDDLEPWYEHLYCRASPDPAIDPAPCRPGRASARRGVWHRIQTAFLPNWAIGRTASIFRRRAWRWRKAPARLALRRCDLGVLPYGDASFDAVVCAGSTLNFVDEPDARWRRSPA
jgi:hypothetical protein